MVGEMERGGVRRRMREIGSLRDREMGSEKESEREW